MLRRVLAFFAKPPFYVGFYINGKDSIALHTTTTLTRLGYKPFSPRGLLVTVAMRSYEKKGMLSDPSVYTIHFYKDGGFGLIKNGPNEYRS